MPRYTANMTDAAKARYAHYKHHSARLAITARHYDQLVEMMTAGAKGTTRPMQEWHERYAANGWSTRKFLFDWLLLAPAEKRRQWFDEVYDYMNDDHVASALAAAAKEFGIEGPS